MAGAATATFPLSATAGAATTPFNIPTSTSPSLSLPSLLASPTTILEEQTTEGINAISEPCDPRFQLTKCKLPPPVEFEPVEKFVIHAVTEQHERTDQNDSTSQHYRAIIDSLRTKSDLSTLTNILLAMRTSHRVIHLVTSGTNKHSRLMHHLVRFDPFTGVDDALLTDYDLADAHLHLLVALVSANSVFLVPTMRALWELLTRHRLGTLPDDLTQRLHAALATIVRLCPKGKMEIFAIMASNAPFRGQQEERITWYYNHCLQVVEYVPGIEGSILELLVDKCLEMDVEIKIRDGGETSLDHGDGNDCDDDAIQDVFQLDLDDDAIPAHKKSTILLKDTTVDEMADKLDSLMNLTLGYVERRAKQNLANIYALYPVISRAFESSILITHKSKFVQFLVLHLCGLESNAVQDQEDALLLYREFASKLLDIILDPYRSTVSRQSAVCYLASFVSRGSFICPETVCEAVSALLCWAEAYVQSLATLSVHAVDLRNQCSLHSLFYTVCQAAFYIMCFRGDEAVRFHEEVIDIYQDPSRIDIGCERWTRLCQHPLNPLRYCLDSVRSEFLMVSRVLRLLQEDAQKQFLQNSQGVMSSNLKAKKMVRKIATPAMQEIERRTGGVGGLGRGSNPLDSFFPFDPYLLRRSNQFIEPFYFHWPGSISDRERAEGDSHFRSNQNNLACGDHVNSDDNEEEEEGDDDEDSASDSSEKDEDHVSRDPSSFEPMSLGSYGTQSVANQELSSSPKREDLREAWSLMLSRTRAPSIEKGSW